VRAARTATLAFAVLAIASCNADGDAEADAERTAVASERGGANAAVAAAEAEDSQAVQRALVLARAQGSDAQRSKSRQAAASELQGLRFVVDQSDRKLRVFRGEQLLRTHDVAVGTEDNPTPVGEFNFHRVDLNPRWVPPDSDWAEDREPKPPGHPENPMGRARLVYQMPYTIHGTDALDSLGKATSHGSIRVANQHVVELAELLLKAGNSWEGPKWFEEMTENREEEYQVPLESKVPLKIEP
jgi:lipoprotein-anchoring transpeptidase ErfK/SrfK